MSEEDQAEVLKLLEEYAYARELWFSGPYGTSVCTLELERDVSDTRARLLAKLGIAEASETND